MSGYDAVVVGAGPNGLAAALTLARAGRLLIGAEWQRPLARVLGPHHPAGPRESLDPRLIQRWAAGERPVPEWVAPVLAPMLDKRARQLEELAWQCEDLAAELRGGAKDDDRPTA